MARVAALVPDLMFASRIEETLRTAGHDVVVVPTIEAIEAQGGADLVIADVAEIDPSALENAESPILGFYSHVDVDTRRRAEAAGIDVVVPRSRMVREMPELVDSLLG
jgi:hypothetical protein